MKIVSKNSQSSSVTGKYEKRGKSPHCGKKKSRLLPAD
jgi:hypothetical protein